MKKQLSILLLVMLLISLTANQVQATSLHKLHPTGALLDYMVRQNWPLYNPDQKIPAALDLSSQMPSVLDQGQENSCVAFAAGYYMMSYYEGQVFSPAFIYNSMTHGRDIGLMPSRALEFVTVYGNLPYNMMPYKEGYLLPPTPRQTRDAARYRLAKMHVYSESSIISPISIYDLLMGLYTRHPVVLTLPVNPVFDYTDGRFDDPINYGSHATNFRGYHSVTLLGYDTHARIFKFVNSWGVGWGSRGYAYISFDTVAKYAVNADMLA